MADCDLNPNIEDAKKKTKLKIFYRIQQNGIENRFITINKFFFRPALLHSVNNFLQIYKLKYRESYDFVGYSLRVMIEY